MFIALHEDDGTVLDTWALEDAEDAHPSDIYDARDRAYRAIDQMVEDLVQGLTYTRR